MGQVPFAEALGDLLSDYSKDDPDQIITAMECALDGLRDDEAVRGEKHD